MTGGDSAHGPVLVIIRGNSASGKSTVAAEIRRRRGRYGEMLTGLIRDHDGPSRCYYLDVPFEETLRRHMTKAEALTYGEPELRGWYRERDLLGETDRVIGAGSSLTETVDRIMTETGLADDPGRAPNRSGSEKHWSSPSGYRGRHDFP